MPIERNTTNTARPLKPSLATARTAKTPIAPRLAPSAASSTATAPAIRTPRSVVGSTPRVHTPAHEDATPVKAFVGSNVTPRSSSRKSRVGGGSANSTPGGTPATTPSAARPVSFADHPQKEHGGLAPGAYGGAQRRPKSVIGGNTHNVTSTPRLPLSNLYTDAERTRTAPSSPMFFHANDARAPEPQPQPQSQPHKKAPTFFYANGQQDASVRSPPVPSPPLSAVGRLPSESKFFHADSLSDTRGSPPILTPPPVPASPEPWSNTHSTETQHSLRPISPTKENIHLSYRKGASQVIRPGLSRGLSSMSGSQPAEGANDNLKRRVSGASSVARLNRGHTKSASLSSVDSVHSPKNTPSHEQPQMTPSPLHNEKRVVSMGSIPDGVANMAPESMAALLGLPSPGPASPKGPPAGKSMLEHMNELAANARRERKVLDLEISNNSLLAINRSLEKEMRKQKAELRRFRRMTRAGTFSNDTISHLGEGSATGVSESGELSDMGEGEGEGKEEEDEEEPDPEEESDSSFDESVMSDGALAERDAAHRLRDEKRLRTDLTKHRELLVNSEKMNQSLKRCLNWSEDLIKTGQKALAYKVRASDVQLGGRVLNSEEQPEGDHKGLLSPWSPPSHRETDPMDYSPPSAPDRDSGIDLEGVKHITSGLQGFISPTSSLSERTP